MRSVERRDLQSNENETDHSLVPAWQYPILRMLIAGVPGAIMRGFGLVNRGCL